VWWCEIRRKICFITSLMMYHKMQKCFITYLMMCHPTKICFITYLRLDAKMFYNIFDDVPSEANMFYNIFDDVPFNKKNILYHIWWCTIRHKIGCITSLMMWHLTQNCFITCFESLTCSCKQFVCVLQNRQSTYRPC
jgi:hypothetical protein